MHTIDTDYLVIGCGAAGMAFTDALIAASKAQVVMVDRRHAPGGHWHDAYPFVTLHQPSAYYGVNSLPLGSEAIDRHGPNRGFYERASGAEICAYFRRVMEQSLLPSGQIRYYPMSEYLGNGRFVSRATAVEHQVQVRKKTIDARYLEPAVPARTAPPFEVSPDARCVAVNELARLTDSADGYVIIGSGKTAMDACLWLIELGVAPEAIRWVRPREAWLINRAFAQGGEFVGTLLEGLSLRIEAAAHADSISDLFERLETTRQLMRVDEDVEPTMYKAATISEFERGQLRRIEQVVRRGHVRRIERDAIVFDEGTTPTNSRQLHVHCAAAGLNPAPPVPIFASDRITLQPIRTGLIPFNAAIVGYIEATRDDLAEQNRLCPPNPLPDTPLDWLRGMEIGLTADHAWSSTPDIREWLEHARLNASRGLRRFDDDVNVQQARRRYAENVRPALARLNQLIATSGPRVRPTVA